MKSKAPLALMEQMVMLLVFALAAALCLQAFVKSDQISQRSQARSNAALAAQNMAEMLRHSGGSMEHALKEAADRQGGSYLENADEAGGIQVNVFYDEDWQPTGENGVYLLTVQGIPAGEEGLQKVLVQVVQNTADLAVWGDQAQQGLLFELETAWLEVNGHE